MAATKSRSTAAQRTTTGAGDSLSLSTVYGATLCVTHVNGTGTITAQGTADVEVQTAGGSTWYTLTTLGFGTTASATVESVIDLPVGVGAVRLNYTAPTGSTGHTLDYEVGTITGI